MNISYQQVMDAIGALPEFTIRGDTKRPGLSYPILAEAEGRRFVVFMAYYYGEHIPDRFYLYDIDSGAAEAISNAEAMERFELESLEAEVPELPEDEPINWAEEYGDDAEEEEDDEPFVPFLLPDEELLRIPETEEESEEDDWDDGIEAVSINEYELTELFARALAEGTVQGEANRRYLNKLMHVLPGREARIYWALAQQ